MEQLIRPLRNERRHYRRLCIFGTHVGMSATLQFRHGNDANYSLIFATCFSIVAQNVCRIIITRLIMSNPAFARCAPFVVYMVFIGIEQALRYLGGKGVIPVSESSLLYLYPVKVMVVAALLIFCVRRCDELSFRDLRNLPVTAASIVAGLVVFILWINMDWTFGSGGPPPGYDPYLVQGAGGRTALIAIRIAGASLVVPLMEELFWRSFLLRYLIKNEFTSVPVGAFTWGSFAVVAVLFGLEHHFIIAGVMAGVAYNLLAVYTRSIAQCVLSHAVTNLVLGIYVLTTGRWQFW